MTAPRTFLDQMQDADDERISRLIGLKPASGVPPKTRPDPMDIPAVQGEMDAWSRRGGLIHDDKIGGGVKLPGGTYGGQFSDEEDAAFHDAQSKMEHAKREARFAPLIAAMKQAMAARPDATSRTPKP